MRELDKALAQAEEAMRHRAKQLAASMDAMAFDHEQRAKMLREGANAVRAKAGLPEHI